MADHPFAEGRMGCIRALLTMNIVKVGEITAEIGSNGVRLTWPDGTSVCGLRPDEERSARRAAHQMGYPSLEEMLIEHELIHVVIANLLKFPSPVMLGLRGLESNGKLKNTEETLVMAMQHYLRAAGITIFNALDQVTVPETDPADIGPA